MSKVSTTLLSWRLLKASYARKVNETRVPSWPPLTPSPERSSILTVSEARIVTVVLVRFWIIWLPGVSTVTRYSPAQLLKAAFHEYRYRPPPRDTTDFARRVPVATCSIVTVKESPSVATWSLRLPSASLAVTTNVTVSFARAAKLSSSSWLELPRLPALTLYSVTGLFWFTDSTVSRACTSQRPASIGLKEAWYRPWDVYGQSNEGQSTSWAASGVTAVALKRTLKVSPGSTGLFRLFPNRSLVCTTA
mmetsp:Transcript_33783/g.81904  ORF Transcript_33783/g.81904 Transcript_33783/m.81904 type:complete len:249 (-) Transcript_33783:2970-3716(-)